MKFKDPLATLQYMGGSLPQHFSMLFYASYCWFYLRSDIECSNAIENKDKDSQDIRDNYVDVLIMVIAHLMCINMFIMKKSFSKKSDFGAYMKTFCMIMGIFSYMGSILYIQAKYHHDLNDFEIACRKFNKNNWISIEAIQ